MFTLRRITSENLERNTALGESYVFIDSRKNPDDFRKSLVAMKWGESESQNSNIYGFISCQEGSKLIPLYKNSIYFIMSENGQTFANITFK